VVSFALTRRVNTVNFNRHHGILVAELLADSFDGHTSPRHAHGSGVTRIAHRVVSNLKRRTRGVVLLLCLPAVWYRIEQHGVSVIIT
jgi:hypothetical protein